MKRQNPRQLTFAAIMTAGVDLEANESSAKAIAALVERAAAVAAHAKNARQQPRIDDKIDAIRRCGELADTLSSACLALVEELDGVAEPKAVSA